MSETDLIPTGEVGAILGKSVRTVHRLIKSGELKPAIKIAGASGPYLFHRADIERYQSDHAEPAQAAS